MLHFGSSTNRDDKTETVTAITPRACAVLKQEQHVQLYTVLWHNFLHLRLAILYDRRETQKTVLKIVPFSPKKVAKKKKLEKIKPKLNYVWSVPGSQYSACT